VHNSQLPVSVHAKPTSRRRASMQNRVGPRPIAMISDLSRAMMMSKSERNVRPVSVIERIFDTTAFPSSVDESSVYRTSAWAVAKALCAIALSCTRVTYFRTIFTAGRTKVVPSKRPELRCDRTAASSWPVSSFRAASQIATAAFVWIGRLSDPSEFGADLVNVTGARHELVFRSNRTQ
jgi:hypothetical protein